MKSKIYKNKKRMLISAIFALCALLLQSCLFNIGGCRLSKEDKQWLLNTDTLYYLYNSTDTVAVPVETDFGKGKYEYSWGIPYGDNNYYGYSKIKFALESDSISFGTWINACEENFHILVLIQIGVKAQRFDFYALKDSTTNNSQTVLGKDYTNCFVFSNPEDTVLQEFIFVKEYGVVKFKTYQNDLFELIP